MKRVKELLAAVFLTLVTLTVAAESAPAVVCAGSPHHHALRGGPFEQPRVMHRLTHPHFVIEHPPLARIAAPSHHPLLVPRLRPRRADLRRPDPAEALPSVGDMDTDTDDGVSTVVSYRYRLAADAREADLPLVVQAAPRIPLLWSGSPRGPPVA